MEWQGGATDWTPLVRREWLLTNGLGGYASGTVSGAQTRRYHSYLVAALAPPIGRILVLGDLEERVGVSGEPGMRLGGQERPDALELHGARFLREFRLEDGQAIWTYDFDGVRIEKRLLLPHRKNLACVTWKLLDGADQVMLRVAPLVHFRSHDTPVTDPLRPEHYRSTREEGHIRIECAEGGFPAALIGMSGRGASFVDEPRVVQGMLYQIESSRGYGSVGDRWAPGHFAVELKRGDTVGLAVAPDGQGPLPNPCDPALAQTERARRAELIERAGPWARAPEAAELVMAADQFVIVPPRERRVEGELPCTVIAGYHWFTDWGRDTMISLEGLALATGRFDEARAILLTFARHVRDGLIPNLFPDGKSEGLYHTADATLWFFHAVDRYTRVTGDRAAVIDLLPTFREIVQRHIEGTRFGIGVDPADGLLHQGAEGYALTWMDAKMGDWVVTPRRGKAVEINALWYNALRVIAEWEEKEDGDFEAAMELAARAERVRESFNARFWIQNEGYLYDVVDGEAGDDAAFRPNQLFAIALPYPVLDPKRWQSVVDQVGERLLTPVGLRSLAPGHPDYKPKYFGDLRTRDAAYHQGTVWAWLIGPYVDAWLKLHPDDRAGVRRILSGLLGDMGEACLGTIAEVFDAEAPYTPRGCVAQAWSIAEMLRCWRLSEK